MGPRTLRVSSSFSFQKYSNKIIIEAIVRVEESDVNVPNIQRWNLCLIYLIKNQDMERDDADISLRFCTFLCSVLQGVLFILSWVFMDFHGFLCFSSSVLFMMFLWSVRTSRNTFVHPSARKKNLDQLYSSLNQHNTTANPSDHIFSESWCHPPILFPQDCVNDHNINMLSWGTWSSSNWDDDADAANALMLLMYWCC